MKKLITIVFILKCSLTFSQDFNDKIITWTGDTIKCQITLINDYDIFYDIKVKYKINKESISTIKVKNYILNKESKPDMFLTKNKSEINTQAKYDSILLDKKSIKYKNGYAINIESFLAMDFKLSFTHKLDTGLYFETMLSYNIPQQTFQGNNEYSFIEYKDPYVYYGRFQIRAGLKLYTSNRFYICPTFLYNYGSFNKKDDIIYESGKTYYNVTRYKNDYEFFLKWGWTFHSQHFFQDIYMGAGMRLKYLNDNVYAIASNGGNYMPVDPYNKKTSYGVITLHLGFQIGYGK